MERRNFLRSGLLAVVAGVTGVDKLFSLVPKQIAVPLTNYNNEWERNKAEQLRQFKNRCNKALWFGIR